MTPLRFELLLLLAGVYFSIVQIFTCCHVHKVQIPGCAKSKFTLQMEFYKPFGTKSKVLISQWRFAGRVLRQDALSKTVDVLSWMLCSNGALPTSSVTNISCPSLAIFQRIKLPVDLQIAIAQFSSRAIAAAALTRSDYTVLQSQVQSRTRSLISRRSLTSACCTL